MEKVIGMCMRCNKQECDSKGCPVEKYSKAIAAIRKQPFFTLKTTED